MGGRLQDFLRVGGGMGGRLQDFLGAMGARLREGESTTGFTNSGDLHVPSSGRTWGSSPPLWLGSVGSPMEAVEISETFGDIP